jgi:hypothetical protein
MKVGFGEVPAIVERPTASGESLAHHRCVSSAATAQAPVPVTKLWFGLLPSAMLARPIVPVSKLAQ